MLLPYLNSGLIEAGCDEAGRGCLAGNVVAAAVILPTDYVNPLLNDSKKLTAKQRYALREQIEHEALAWAVGVATPEEIDNINILHASFLAMHRALDQLKLRPEAVIVDGNHFDPYVIGKGLPNEGKLLPHTCIVKGDGKYLSIAAASILAKTYRDDYMTEQALRFPFYGWEKNKGYPTKTHYQGIEKHGLCALHRKSFNTQPNLSKGKKHELDEGELVFK
ncbi:MAG: ribonuclease HII [Prevotella salivae]|uniref:ribonuclease HII n=1 Tax=Segatella salivae TaxID=228604 RepID=UPI001CAAC3D2|nr:ribonuclease HII [Segatella salivae]MBF1549910.1 ribonuclease HII [Segatella salivae]